MIKRYSTFIFFIICLVITSAQNLTITYELNYKPSSSRKDSTRSKIYYLDILNNESVFRDNMRRHSDSIIYYGNGYGLGYPLNISDQLYLKKDLKTHTIFKYLVLPLSRDEFYVNINEPLNWKLFLETKMVGEIKCQKAEVDYGGRHWVAWFAQDIHISEGPYVFNGLPGLIIEIFDSNKDYRFKLAKIKKSNHNTLFAIKGGREVSWEEMTKIQQDFYSDPYSFVKVQSIKVMTDDGSGGRKNVDLRESTLSIQSNLKEYNNVIELNKKIDYK